MLARYVYFVFTVFVCVHLAGIQSVCVRLSMNLSVCHFVSTFFLNSFIKWIVTIKHHPLCMPKKRGRAKSLSNQDILRLNSHINSLSALFVSLPIAHTHLMITCNLISFIKFIFNPHVLFLLRAHPTLESLVIQDQTWQFFWVNLHTHDLVNMTKIIHLYNFNKIKCCCSSILHISGVLLMNFFKSYYHIHT